MLDVSDARRAASMSPSSPDSLAFARARRCSCQPWRRAVWGDVVSGDNLFGLLGYLVGPGRRPVGGISGHKTLAVVREVEAVRGVRSAAEDADGLLAKCLKSQGLIRFLDAADLVP